jgi:hypothetical protein
MSEPLSRKAASPRATFRQAEQELLERRTRAPDMEGAVSDALLRLLDGNPPPPGAVAAGHAIAAAVAAHAASFAPAGEPAYHNQYHQAEATTAMGWLCARARRLGLLTPAEAAAGVLAMAGHDLLHDGSWPVPGALEARSAALTVALGAQAGLDQAALEKIRRVILATDLARPRGDMDADDLLCRLAQEADVFGSLTPALGWQLSQALGQEWAATGHRFEPSVASFAGRLAFLRSRRPATPPGRELGLDDAVADQIAALAALGGGDPDQGAARLDARPPAQARANYLAALATVVPE